eukprot:5664916-Karenia_brevis.AAC.1
MKGEFGESGEGRRRVEQAAKRKMKEPEESKAKRPTATADPAVSAGNADEGMEAERTPKRQ